MVDDDVIRLLEAMRTDIGAVRTDQEGMRADLGVVRTEQEAMRADLGVVRTEQAHRAAG